VYQYYGAWRALQQLPAEILVFFQVTQLLAPVSTTIHQANFYTPGEVLVQLANAMAGDAQDPTLSLAVDSLGISYGLEIQNADIAASQAITLTADTISGTLTLNGSQLSSGTYNLFIKMVSTTGTVNFYTADIPILATDTHIIAFGAWDGTWTITLEIDRGSNGTVDETVELENQMQYIFLPFIGLR
jgi:hypothetical protein